MGSHLSAEGAQAILELKAMLGGEPIEWPPAYGGASEAETFLLMLVDSLTGKLAGECRYSAEQDARAAARDARAARKEERLVERVDELGAQLEGAFAAFMKEEQVLLGKLWVARGQVKRLRGREQGMRDAFAFALHQEKNSLYGTLSTVSR